MSRKPKFRPEITRIKLNLEQAVLTCECYSVGRTHRPDGYKFPDDWVTVCWRNSRQPLSQSCAIPSASLS